MSVDAVTDFTNTGATTWLFAARACLINRRGLFTDVFVLQNILKVFICKGVARAYIHLGMILTFILKILQMRIVCKKKIILVINVLLYSCVLIPNQIAINASMTAKTRRIIVRLLLFLKNSCALPAIMTIIL